MAARCWPWSQQRSTCTVHLLHTRRGRTLVDPVQCRSSHHTRSSPPSVLTSCCRGCSCLITRSKYNMLSNIKTREKAFAQYGEIILRFGERGGGSGGIPATVGVAVGHICCCYGHHEVLLWYGIQKNTQSHRVQYMSKTSMTPNIFQSNFQPSAISLKINEALNSVQ